MLIVLSHLIVGIQFPTFDWCTTSQFVFFNLSFQKSKKHIKKSHNSLADQHVNINSIKSLNEVTTAKEELAWLIDVNEKYIFITVDNITATGNLEKEIDLEEFIEENNDMSGFIKYNPERFPGLFVRGEFGKTILFKSGKMVFIGSKNIKQIEKNYKFMTERCANI